jgi:DNA-binding response OmpR family regulator
VRRLRGDDFPDEIVVLSAYLTEDQRQAYRDLNVDRMVEKPFDVQKLRELVDALVRAA